jgi:hypothetical protein
MRLMLDRASALILLSSVAVGRNNGPVRAPASAAWAIPLSGKSEATNLGPGLLGKASAVGPHVSLAAEAHSIISMDDEAETTAAEIALPRRMARDALGVRGIEL